LSGQTLAEEQRMASRKAKIVDVLGGAVRRLREKIGEPHDSVQRFSTPLSQATTSSFAALKTWSLGLKALREKGAVAAVPLLSTAVKLDPRFATVTYDLGIAYANSGEEGRPGDLFTEGYALRPRAHPRQRFGLAS